MRWDESLAADGFEARHWRKSSQWATFTRRHAELVAADELVIGRMALRCRQAGGARPMLIFDHQALSDGLVRLLLAASTRCLQAHLVAASNEAHPASCMCCSDTPPCTARATCMQHVMSDPRNKTHAFQLLLQRAFVLWCMLLVLL